MTAFELNLHIDFEFDQVTYVVEFVVEAAGIADGLAVVVASPQRRHRRLAVGAGRSGSPRC